MINSEALMAEWMPAPIVSGVTMGAMGGAGAGFYRCVQWKGNFKDCNPDKIVQIKDQVGIHATVWKCMVVFPQLKCRMLCCTDKHGCMS